MMAGFGLLSPARLGRIGTKPFATVKVPACITAVFWVIKLLSTAMGESVSDALVYGVNRYAAVVLGLMLFAAAIAWQLRAKRYSVWRYWAAVCMVAVFGTMAADVLHIGLHVPYAMSSAFYAVCLAVVLTAWYRVERTLSIHSITTPRREVFYWLTVLCTFALGTAVGDLTARPLDLGYLGSGLMFAALFAVPGLFYGVRRSNAVACFWSAYILTRPFGASFADWLGFARAAGGLGLGHPVAALTFGVPIVLLVTYVAVTKLDTPSRAGPGAGTITAPIPVLRLPEPPSAVPRPWPVGTRDLVAGDGLRPERHVPKGPVGGAQPTGAPARLVRDLPHGFSRGQPDYWRDRSVEPDGAGRNQHKGEAQSHLGQAKDLERGSRSTQGPKRPHRQGN